MVYGLLLVPGLNLIPPFVFFLTFHILYNQSRDQHKSFWKQWDQAFGYIRGILSRRKYSQLNPDMELGNTQETQSGQHRHTHSTKFTAHMATLLVALGVLVFVNVLFIANIEKTLIDNKGSESTEEGEWGFGQVLALLLLVLPLRDAWNAFQDIREGVLKEFEQLFKHEAQAKSVIPRLRALVEEDGAKPEEKMKNEEDGCTTFLQLAAYHGKRELVEFIFDVLNKPLDTIGRI
ncbi:hypothetical protein GYMLUDRAFT_62466 [Collybiopsis luxurians FD-317 M1]|uniref:Unplaced genomic scaffold GYMLUscaffold_57, whole genome shotgun sequence n=1 Tax=Collybiopsis luxurians FD-317 M1 TaxID=944289 RepID=A0A0D0AY35_9AGAR|nr:hypothetical protein GYMLUDRAFT_62466 [Collybiopsis luxurians FD-317 M1]